MPRIFLSPSTQESNPYVDGGNEEYYMNIIADALEPYLERMGVSFVRNDPSGTFSDAVRLSNKGDYDLHLAIHSNAAAGDKAGKVRGSQVYYYPGSSEGKRAADIFAGNLEKIYPLPDKVTTLPTTTLGEIVRTKAPAILIETAFHDNPADAKWIRDNIDGIAENLALSVAQFLGLAMQPGGTETGRVTTQGGRLNLRTEPSVSSVSRALIPNGTVIPLLSQRGKWYLTEYDGKRGYVSSEFVVPVN